MGKGMGTGVRKGMGIGKPEGAEGRRERVNRKWTGRDGKGKGREDWKVGMKRQEARKHKHRASPTGWEYTTKVDSSRIAQQHWHWKTCHIRCHQQSRQQQEHS